MPERQQLHLLAAAVDQSSEGTAVVDMDGHVLFVNKAFAEMHGYEPQEVIGKHLSVFHAPDQMTAVEAINRQIEETGSFRGEVWHARRDGSVFPASMYNTLVRDETDKPFAIIGTLRDISERRAAEQALSDSEQRYRTLFQQANDSIVLIDAETGMLVDFSDSTHRILGYSREELQRLTIADIDAVESSEEVLEHVSKIFREGQQTFETKHRTKGGELRDVLVTSTALRLRGRRFLQSTWRDITEQKRATEALTESEDRYRAMFDGAPQGILIVDPKTKELRYANPAICRMLGYSEQELRRMRVHDIHPRECLERTLADFEIQTRGEVLLTQSLPCLRRNGTVFYADISGTRVSIGGREYRLGFFTDVTERERANEELRKFKTVSDQAGYGAAIADLRGNMIYVNTSFAEMHGGSPEDFVGRHLSTFHNDEQIPHVQALNARLGREGMFVGEEVWHVRRDGSVFPTLMNAAVITDRDGKPKFLSATAIDITKRKQAEDAHRRLEEQLRHAQKMEAVGQLAAGVAHEFNNLLAGIIGNAELLLAKPRGQLPDGFRQPLEDLDRSGRRAAALTQQLLSFSKKKVPATKVFDVNRLLGETEAMLRRLVGQHKTTEVIYATEPCLIEADEGEIEQVFTNLITNARDATADGGKVSVRIANITLGEADAFRNPRARTGPHVELSVTDNGCGMSAQTVERIFEPFFTTKPDGKGVGLGLPTVFANVTRAGGHITVESRLGEGTVFRVCLPRAEAVTATVETDAARSASAPLGGSETILVCDDDDVVLRSSCWLLESGGYSVIAAESGHRALELASLHAGPISLLLTDVIMPEMSGRDLATKLAEQRPGIKVIYTSGYASDVLDAGGDPTEHFEFLQKPSTADDLFRCVRKVLDEAKLDAP